MKKAMRTRGRPKKVEEVVGMEIGQQKQDEVGRRMERRRNMTKRKRLSKRRMSVRGKGEIKMN